MYTVYHSMNFTAGHLVTKVFEEYNKQTLIFSFINKTISPQSVVHIRMCHRHCYWDNMSLSAGKSVSFVKCLNEVVSYQLATVWDANLS